MERDGKVILRRRWMSPAGELIVGSLGDRLCLCDWAVEHRRSTIDCRINRLLHAHMVDGTSEVIEQAIEQLVEYFAGQRRNFDIPPVFAGSEFQCSVWSELMRIPYGCTVSYAEVATRIGHPKAVRAVANAIATNPLSIFVPCHRVIGSTGHLTGYGGGMSAKLTLLQLESSIPTLF